MPEQLIEYNYANLMPNGEQNWGFEIHELHPEQRTVRPYDQVMLFGKLPAHNKVIEQSVEDHYNNGEYEIVPDDDQSVAPYMIDVKVPATELSEKVGRDIAPGRITALTEIDESLRTALADYYPKDEIASAIKVGMRLNRKTDYTGLPEDCFEEGMTVSQIFEVQNGRGGSFNIINFSEMALEGDHLQQLMNAIREMDDLTGGASTTDVSAIAILPRSAPRWKQNVTGSDTELGNNEVLAVATAQQAIVFNEVLFQPDKFKYANGAENNTAGGEISPIQTAAQQHFMNLYML